MQISLPSRSAEAKMKRLKPAVFYIPNRWRKIRSICFELKLLKFNNSRSATIQSTLSYGKSKVMTQKRTLSILTPVRIVYKGNFKNFFQMTMFFLAYVVTFLG